MEELSLTPSAPVWQKVEEQIRKKRDRRRLIFWLLPLLLVGGGAGWMLWGTGKEVAPADTVSVTRQQPAPSATSPAPTPVQSTPLNGTEKDRTATTQQVELPTKENNHSTSTAKPTETFIAEQPKLTATLKPLQEEAVREKETSLSTAGSLADKKETQTGNDVTTTEIAVAKEGIVISEERPRRTEPVADTAVTSLKEEALNKSTEVASPEAPVALTPVPATDSGTLMEKAPEKKLKASKWEWMVHAEAGITSVWSSLFELPSTRSQDMFSSPTQYSGGNFFAYYPSTQEEGPAFSAGFTAKRILNGRTKLTAGLQYNFYGTRMAVGQEKNANTLTSVPYARQSATTSNAYLPGTQNNYSNRYHFIQLPVGIEYQVFRKVPLQVHGGLSLAHLVKTNALTYDYNAQAYYQNSSAYKATQLHLFTNVTYTLWKGKAVKLDAGPYVQYSLAELQKTAPDKNRLFSTGLRTQVSF